MEVGEGPGVKTGVYVEVGVGELVAVGVGVSVFGGSGGGVLARMPGGIEVAELPDVGATSEVGVIARGGNTVGVGGAGQLILALSRRIKLVLKLVNVQRK